MTYVAVVGGSHCSDSVAALAEETGAELARRGCVVVNGGLTGVMEASAKGATSEGGTVVGISPYEDRDQANHFSTVVVSTGIGPARNLSVVASADVVIAIGGEWGTLSEIAMARCLGRQVVLLRTWQLQHPDFELDGLHYAESPQGAVNTALELAQSSLEPRSTSF